MSMTTCKKIDCIQRRADDPSAPKPDARYVMRADDGLGGITVERVAGEAPKENEFAGVKLCPFQMQILQAMRGETAEERMQRELGQHRAPARQTTSETVHIPFPGGLASLLGLKL